MTLFLKFGNHLMVPLILTLMLACNANSQDKTGNYPFPDKAAKVSFRERKGDSLVKILDIDVLDDSAKEVIGYISSINFGPKSIYLADYKQNKVFILDRRTFGHTATLGGTGKSPSDLDHPFGLQVFQDKLIVPNGRGSNLFSFYSLNGKFISAIPRESFDNNSSMDYSLFMKDSKVYMTVGIARNRKKVKVYDLNNPTKSREILHVSDFHSNSDSLNFDKLLTMLFLSRSTKDTSIFYAMPSNKPLVNIYKMDGKLLESYDLRSIPALAVHYDQHTDLYEKIGLTSNMYANYFSNMINDGNDNLIFACQNIISIEKALEDLAAGKVNLSNLETSYIFVNIKNKTYQLLKCGELFDTKPMKVIDGKLWCFDPIKSRIVVYQLPNS